MKSVGEVAEVGVAEIDGTSRDAELLDVLAGRRVGKAGNAPDLVVGGQHLGDAVRDASGRPGDENLLVAQHEQRPSP